MRSRYNDPFVKEAARRALAEAGPDGLTWAELAETIGTHHGVASGRLSLMHRDGEIARLSARRGSSKIYVAKEFIDGRKTDPYGRQPKPCQHCGLIP